MVARDVETTVWSSAPRNETVSREVVRRRSFTGDSCIVVCPNDRTVDATWCAPGAPTRRGTGPDGTPAPLPTLQPLKSKNNKRLHIVDTFTGQPTRLPRRAPAIG